MLRRTLCLLLIAAAGGLQAQSDANPAELARINAAIARVEGELAESRSERGTVAGDIEAAEKAILDNQRQIDSVQVALAAQQSQLDELHARQHALEAESAAQRELIATYARSAWMSGNEEYLKLVLNQEDPGKSARMLRYYGYLSNARAEKLAAFQQTLDAVALVATDIETATAALADQQQTLTARQLSLSEGQQQRQQLLTRLDANLAAQNAQLDQLELDKVEIELLLQELQSSLDELTPDEEQQAFAELKGRMPWPLNGPHVNGFGERHSLGDLTWEGVTIGATAGADVRAIHHGRVVFADWFTTSGLLLIIDHGDGYMSLYAHNQELYKAVGEWVAAGDVIAAAGNTGGQREASLYFEIRRNGRAEDPASWCVPR
jgi:septal ring factor EnvC (AmiA/AmiB activator)